MTSSVHLHRLSMLSELKLPENAFIPAFLNQLYQHFPSYSNSYCWTDQKFIPLDIYDDLNQHELVSGITTFIKKHSTPSLESLFDQQYILTTDPLWKGHFLSKLYRQCFLANGYHQSVILPINTKKYVHGFLILNWQHKTAEPKQRLLPWIEEVKAEFKRGLANCSDQEKTTGGWRSGLIIVDQRGEMTHCCPEGKNLLTLALQKKPGNLRRISFDDVRNIPEAVELIARLLDSENAETNHELNIKSLWGEFKINAYPLHDDAGQRAPQVYLNITWQVPFSLLLFHNIDAMCFTPRQEEIGLLYAAGESTKSISNKLELSLYTTKEHIQHIFEKLHIHTRAELIEHIICRDSGTGMDESELRHLHRAERATMNLRRS